MTPAPDNLGVDSPPATAELAAGATPTTPGASEGQKDVAPPPHADAAGRLSGSAERAAVTDDDGVNPLEFEGAVDSNHDLPTPETIREIDRYVVLDRDGKSHTFRSLYTGRHTARRVLIIFVRHFYCGNCQEYLRVLAESVTPEALLALPLPTFIAVVGCGDPALIDMYAAATGCPFPIYADPTRRLYAALGMVRTLALGARPAYARRHLLASSALSVVQGLKQIPKGLALKGGDSKQIGGEFLFEPVSVVERRRERQRDRRERETKGMDGKDGNDGREQAEQGDAAAAAAAATPAAASPGLEVTTPVGLSWEEEVEAVRRRQRSGRPSSAESGGGGEPSLDGKGEPDEGEDKVVTWCHRMKTTRDHAEIPELMEVLGLDGHGRPIEDRDRWERALRERKGTGVSLAGEIKGMKAGAGAP